MYVKIIVMMTAYQRAMEASVLLKASPSVMLPAACAMEVMDSPSTASIHVTNGNIKRAEAIRTMIGRSISIILALPLSVFSSPFISPGASPYFALNKMPSSANCWLFFIGP